MEQHATPFDRKLKALQRQIEARLNRLETDTRKQLTELTSALRGYTDQKIAEHDINLVTKFAEIHRQQIESVKPLIREPIAALNAELLNTRQHLEAKIEIARGM